MGATLAYAAAALAGGAWLSGAAAPVVAGLLALRHRRARFAAYVLWTLAAVRGVATGRWALAGAALAVIGLLQTPPARALWPRVGTGRAARESAAPPTPPRDTGSQPMRPRDTDPGVD